MASAVETHPAAPLGSDAADRESEIVVPAAHDYVVNKLTIEDIRASLRAGYEDFKAQPSHMLILGLIYPLGAAIAAGVALGLNFLPLAFPIVAGMALMGPVAAIVLYEISRRHEKGERFDWRETGALARRVSTGGVAIVAFALIAFFAVWLVFAQNLFVSTYGSTAVPSIGEFFRNLFFTGEGWRMIIFGNLIGLVFAATVLATNIVSFPLMLDRNAGAAEAIATSLRVTLKNPLVVAAWGLMVAVAMLAGSLVFLAGLGLVVPVLGHATWHFYRRAVS